MRKTMTFILTVLAASALLLTGCNPILPSGGKSVKFTANSKSQLATKTTYAGNAASTGSTHEDIYWSPNDAIRIYSGDPSVVRPVIQTENGVCADYKLVVPNATSTRASLENEASNGLEWLDDPTGTAVTFYAVYPPSTQGSENGWFTMSIPSEQTFATPTGTDMTHAYMLAQNTLTRSQFNSEVSLEFYPAFTAFQINLKSKDDELTLKKFRIYSEDNHLAGDYYGKLKAVNTSESENEYFAFNTDKSLRMDFAYCSDNLQNEVFVEFPYYETETETQKNTKISPTSAVDFTLLALPYGIVNATETYDTKPYLTNLWLEVTFLNEDGEEVKKKLALKQTTTDEDVTTTAFLKFASCKKYRINGLAIDKGSRWQLQIDDQVLPWIADEQTTSFKNQIGITGRAPVGGYIETAEVNEPGGSQNWPLYYTRLTVNCNVSDPCIEFTFTPTAPIGGYWRLSPEDVIPGSLNYFKITTSDMINGESERLQGQVMVQPVTIYIRPTAEYLALDPAPVYSIIIHCDMSPSVTFDPLYSADSEFQRQHSDGRFSYYKFVIAK